MIENAGPPSLTKSRNLPGGIDAFLVSWSLLLT